MATFLHTSVAESQCLRQKQPDAVLQLVQYAERRDAPETGQSQCELQRTQSETPVSLFGTDVSNSNRSKQICWCPCETASVFSPRLTPFKRCEQVKVKVKVSYLMSAAKQAKTAFDSYMGRLMFWSNIY